MNRSSLGHSQNNSPRPPKGKLLAVIVAALTMISVILSIINDGANIFDRIKGLFTRLEKSPAVLDTATQKANLAISKAKNALEKAELETARDELQIAIQELENIPHSQGIENQIQTKKLEYMKTINQIDLALQKRPCYELLWETPDCQEYPFKLD